MQLVVGGAYSGKRSVVRDQYNAITWHSAYNDDRLTNWDEFYDSSTTFVIEGWERWVKQELNSYSNLDEVKSYFFNQIDKICEREKIHEKPIILIMLEVGRGIVPLKEEDRNLRDVAGWLLQYAAKKAETVHYCWHGLVKTIK